MAETAADTANLASVDFGQQLVSEQSLNTSVFENTGANVNGLQDILLLEPITIDSEEKYLEDLDSGNLEAISRLQQLVEQTSQKDPELLGGNFIQRYMESGNLNDLEASVKHFKAVLDLTLEGQPDRANVLQNLGPALINRYQRLGDLKDLEMALEAMQKAVDLTPPGHPDQARRLQNLAASFTARYQRLGDLKDLEAASKITQEAVDLTPSEHPERACRLHSLAVSFIDQYRRLGELKILEAALEAAQEAVDLTPPEHPDRARRLQNLAVSLTDRYQRRGDLKDLEAALQADQEAVDLTPSEHPDRAHRLQNLAVSLTDRYWRLGDLKDLEAALQINQEAVDLTPVGHPRRADQLESLAISFGKRYQRVGDLKDLETALQGLQEAVVHTPPEHPDRAGRLQNLATLFRDRYQRLGDLKDLEAALKIDQEAVDLTPSEHPERARRLHNLAASFTDQYRRLGELKALEAALEAAQEAVALTPPEHPDRAGRLQHLAMLFTDQYRRLGDLKDLEAALKIDQEAVDLTPPEHPDRARRLHSLASSLSHRYRRLGELKDLEAALETDKEAVDLTPPQHPDRADRLQNLATSFTHRYQQLRDLKDLEAALQTGQKAVELTPPGHPRRPERLQGLAMSFRNRYERLRDPKDLETIHTHYHDSFKLPSMHPETSWDQALSWAYFAESFQSSDCIFAFQAAFRLLPEILWAGHSIPVHHDAIRRLNISDATSIAARTCINLSHLHDAVEMLEQGLATIFQQMLQLKTDVDGLPPHQAKDFLNLSMQLYSGTFINSPISIVEDRKKLLEDIRNQPGFESFLRPKSYNILCHASERGPVITLTSHKDHCDAIILLNPSSEPVHVPLPIVTLELLKSQRDMLKDLLGRCNARSRGQSSSSRLFGQREDFSKKSTQECFQDMLDWLWTHVVGPVYQVLKSHGIFSGRLWWLPTGAFAGLPLHASSPTNEFIHSYTATLGSLLDAYSKKSSSIAPKLVVVGVTHTDFTRGKFLNGVEPEVKKIMSIAKDSDVRCLLGEQATVDAVKQQLQDCSWVHLACHGYQNLQYPTQSHLQLYGGDLELGTILRMPLPNAQFVFLAACQTAMGDAQLVNESFHLGGGFITAGFQSAIGTIWSMNDSDGPTVAEIVYSHLFREGQHPKHTKAAEALHLAVKELKNRKVPYERWMPFIHIGV